MLSGLTSKSHGQFKPVFAIKSLDVELGISKSIGKDIARVYNYGTDQAFGLHLTFLNHRISVVPFYNYRIFSNTINRNVFYENLYFRSIGGKIAYNIKAFSNKHIYFYPFINIGKTKFKDFFINDRRDRVVMIKGDIYTVAAGIGFSTRNFFWEISYIPVKGIFPINKDLLDELSGQGYNVVPEQSLSLSHLSILIGFHIPLFAYEK